MFGFEREALRKKCRRQELKVGGVKILSSSLGMIRMDRIRDEYIRGTAHVFDVLDVYSGGSVDVSLEAVVPNPRLRIGAGLVGHLVHVHVHCYHI